MAKKTHEANDEIMVQLATRIPKALHQRLKLHSIHANESISDLVAEAVEALLKQGSGKGKGKREKAASEAA